MERHYFGLSTLLASVALLIWSIGETFAFPQGPNVSMGSNPIMSYGGVITNGTQSVDSFSNADFIVSDLVITSSGKPSYKLPTSGFYNGNCVSDIVFSTTTQTNVASFQVRTWFDSGTEAASIIDSNIITHSFQSGLRIPTNEELFIENSGTCEIAYTISGYLAH
jgi:hypothetical protein